MGIVDGIKSIFGTKEQEIDVTKVISVSDEHSALEGQENTESTLSTKTITFIFCNKTDILPRYSQLFANELKVPIGTVRSDIKRILDNLIDDLQCCIEYPYVDEYYRDTYYSYYSRKHFEYSRYCFRISFFSRDVSEQSYFADNLDGKYYGYMVLRPTPRRVIGYTFLSPIIYKDNSFSICQCTHLTSVMGRRQETSAFPFCGQDGEVTLCVETSIVMLFDYFSRRYNKYSRLLPSAVLSLYNDNYANKLQLSRGMDVGAANSIISALGMNTRIIELEDEENPADNDVIFEKDQFVELLKIYVDSGFPIFATTQNHAFLIVGRENKLFCQDPKLITVNDGYYPYSKWDLSEDEQIESFLVPLPENVLLDADKINATDIYDMFSHESNTEPILKEGESYYHRIYLTTSRAFKQYIVKSDISFDSKKTIVSIAMPRFIWVCETIKNTDLQNNIQDIPVTSTLLMDATVYPMENNHLLMVKTQEKLIMPSGDNIGKTEKSYELKEAREVLRPFNNNLKGEHNNWKG